MKKLLLVFVGLTISINVFAQSIEKTALQPKILNSLFNRMFRNACQTYPQFEVCNPIPSDVLKLASPSPTKVPLNLSMVTSPSPLVTITADYLQERYNIDPSQGLPMASILETWKARTQKNQGVTTSDEIEQIYTEFAGVSFGMIYASIHIAIYQNKIDAANSVSLEVSNKLKISQDQAKEFMVDLYGYATKTVPELK